MKKVVIVGGGFAGSMVARKLEKHFSVTLIDSKDYFEFTPGVLRTIVDPLHAAKIQVQHQLYLHKARVVCGMVTEIGDKYVALGKEKKERYPYDYLVLATGSRYFSPFKEHDVVVAARAQQLLDYHNRVKTAQSILVIGGGVVGVELAAEIIESYPGKELTIVNGGPYLLERSPPQARAFARQFLKNNRVEVINNERVVKRKKKMFVTSTDRMLRADLAFLCVGIMPNSDCFSTLGEHVCDASQFLLVNQFLQQQGKERIFVAGDVAAVVEEKLAQSAEKQGKLVADNIRRHAAGKSMQPYFSKSRPMVISLGKWNGIFIYRNFVIGGLLPGLLKHAIEWKAMRAFR